MYDVIIVGAGPAGLTAAIYCGRSKLRTKLIDKSVPGGQINITEEIENFPGVFKANSKKLVEVMVKQAKEFSNVEWDEFKEVSSIGYDAENIKIGVQSVIDEKKIEYNTKTLILATGAHPKMLGIPGEQDLQGKGVSYCAVCDGPLFRNKDVILVGGGDTALEEAIYLTKFVNKVKVVHRRENLRAIGLLQERARNNPKIEFVLSSVAVEILGQERVEKVRIRDVGTNKESEISCSGVFIFAGYSPNTDFIDGFLDLDSDKFIITDEEMKTKKKGIFACGDCRRRPFKQIITACGEGAIAAHKAEHYITQENV